MSLLLGLLLLAAPASALETLRLPWIFSDEPELTADFSFSPGGEGLTRVELALGGRFARFGLPFGAARPPVLEIRCEVVSPGDFIRQVAVMEGRIDLQQALDGYGAPFSRGAFSKKSPYVFKAEMRSQLRPGDYNVIVELRDKELSIHSRRTLHLIVPDLRGRAWRLSDLKFLLGVGEEVDEKGRARRVLDPNPWRQCGGASGWDLLVAYDTLGPRPAGKLRRRHKVTKLRSQDGPLWAEEGEAPAKKEGQFWLARLEGEPLRKLGKGIYQFEVELWSEGRAGIHASKTFEVP